MKAINPTIPTIILTFMSITAWFVHAVFGLPIIAYHTDSSISDFLLFHFFHANIFHLLGNLLALWLFRPRISTLLVTYPIATLSAYLDSLIPSLQFSIFNFLPTCGLSAILFASFARYYVAWHKPVYPIFLITLITAFLPYINWHIHLIAFFLSYFAFSVIYQLKSKPRFLFI